MSLWSDGTNLPYASVCIMLPGTLEDNGHTLLCREVFSCYLFVCSVFSICEMYLKYILHTAILLNAPQFGNR